MRLVVTMIVSVVTTAAAINAPAQFVKGNEAVHMSAAGRPTADTAPLPKSGPAVDVKPCAATGGCNGGPWLMVETNDGLRECTEAYARPGTCRASSYGSKKISRLWVVKSGTTWLQCTYPDLKSKCVNMFARFPANLPTAAVQ